MKEMHCYICGILVAVIKPGSRIRADTIAICGECNAAIKRSEWATESASCEVVDQLFSMMNLKK